MLTPQVRRAYDGFRARTTRPSPSYSSAIGSPPAFSLHVINTARAAQSRNRPTPYPRRWNKLIGPDHYLADPAEFDWQDDDADDCCGG